MWDDLRIIIILIIIIIMGVSCATEEKKRDKMANYFFKYEIFIASSSDHTRRARGRTHHSIILKEPTFPLLSTGTI
jgi:hypothetical protein